MTKAQIYEILEGPESVSVRANFYFLFVTCSVFIVYWLVKKTFSLKCGKMLPFIKIQVCATFK